jgi:hypothetical protein
MSDIPVRRGVKGGKTPFVNIIYSHILTESLKE